jgi:hypothetical protein
LAGPLSAQELENEETENIFPSFLSALVKGHRELRTVAMPDIEIYAGSGMKKETLYIITFKIPRASRSFAGVLEKENIPYSVSNTNERQFMLFMSDMLAFMMKPAE